LENVRRAPASPISYLIIPISLALCAFSIADGSPSDKTAFIKCLLLFQGAFSSLG